MTIHEKDFQTLREMIEGKTYEECKGMFELIRDGGIYFDFNFKSIACTISCHNGKPELSNFVECWEGDTYFFQKIEK